VNHENWARDRWSSGQFRDGSRDKERSIVGAVEGETSSEEGAEVCVTEWVEVPEGNPVTCSFLKLGSGKKDDMKFTFDVSKCDKLFDMLLQNKVIRLKGGHVILAAEQLARRKYCKWHDSFPIQLTNVIISVGRSNRL
jgi:hypothetical protein